MFVGDGVWVRSTVSMERVCYQVFVGDSMCIRSTVSMESVCYLVVVGDGMCIRCTVSMEKGLLSGVCWRRRARAAQLYGMERFSYLTFVVGGMCVHNAFQPGVLH